MSSLFAVETESLVLVVSLVVGGVVGGFAAAYATIKRTNSEESRKDKEQQRQHDSVTVVELTGIVAELRGRIEAQDRRLDTCHEERNGLIQRIAWLEGAAGKKPGEQTPPSETHSPSATQRA